MRNHFSRILLISFFGVFFVQPPIMNAQTLRDSHPFSVGVMAGPTSGVTFKAVFESSQIADHARGVDSNLSFNLDDYLLWSTHFTIDIPVPSSPLTFYMGPGFFAGYEGKALFWGPAVNVGASFVRNRYEVFLQIMPRVTIVPDLDGKFGVAVGLRYII
jgi:hypothetical protein